MKLPPQEAQQFLDAYKPLLEYVYFENYGKYAESINEYKDAKDLLFENFNFLEKYLAINEDLSEKQKEIILSLKNSLTGTFIYIKTLKKYSLLLDPETNEIYCVLGLNDSLKELGLYNYSIIETTIIEYNKLVFCDGLISSKNISIGSSFRSDVNELYKSKKENKKLKKQITSRFTGPA